MRFDATDRLLARVLFLYHLKKRFAITGDVRFQPAAHPLDTRWVGKGPATSGHGGNPLEVTKTLEQGRM